MLFSSASVSGLDAAGGRAPTCTQSPEVLAPGVPLGQVRLHQLSHRRELDGAPVCLAQGSGVPSPKGQSLLGLLAPASHGAALFLCVTAGFPRLPCTCVPSRRESLAASVSQMCACFRLSLALFILFTCAFGHGISESQGIAGRHQWVPSSGSTL